MSIYAFMSMAEFPDYYLCRFFQEFCSVFLSCFLDFVLMEKLNGSK
jgi:hypothetical protein